MNKKEMEARMQQLLQERDSTLLSRPPPPSRPNTFVNDGANSSSSRGNTTTWGSLTTTERAPPPPPSSCPPAAPAVPIPPADAREERLLIDASYTIRAVPYAHAHSVGEKFFYAAADRGCRTVAARMLGCMMRTYVEEPAERRKMQAILRKAALQALRSAHLDLAVYIVVHGLGGDATTTLSSMKGREEEEEDTISVIRQLLFEDERVLPATRSLGGMRPSGGDGEKGGAIEERLSSVATDVVRLRRLTRRVLLLREDRKGDDDDGKATLLCRQLPRWLESLARGCRDEEEGQGKEEDGERAAAKLCPSCEKNYLPRDAAWLKWSLHDDFDGVAAADAVDNDTCCAQCHRARDFRARLSRVAPKECDECGEPYLAFAHRIRLYKDGCTDWAKCPSCGNVERADPGEHDGIGLLSQEERMSLALAGLLGARR